ncbi:RagB/SusD family nutrient uptake outer membrane protein [Pedobacter sp. SD-b]|uniref:RagB/SusD family nutrient uptake outer membrane protein n=2 Tax=Pedobacter segetis TaxID=2793069 RepID=A0ABS1BJR9_9SPHI|nr:RagB/SusD family nutrient uptake outer membrane protein [Pedobacter segetis]
MTLKLNKLVIGTVTLLVSIIFIPSCKNYLEVAPISSFGPEYVFSNVGNADKAVLGAYSYLGGDNGYGIRLSMYYPYDNDEMMGQGATPYPDNERRDIAHYNVNAGNTQLSNPFSQLFKGVEMSNICIYNIPKMNMYNSGTDAQKKQLKKLYGEALTLRAQYYFELIRNWGDLPARYLPASFETELYKAKSDRDEIYDHLLDDLATAEDIVPWKSQAGTTNERITQGAVRGLRARIALFRGGYSLRVSRQMERGSDFKKYYQIAYDECNKIIQSREHNLNPSFQSIFKDGLDAHVQGPYGEIIWEIGMSGGASSYGDSKLGYYNGPRLNGSTGNGALTILPTYFYSFDANDTRRDVTCAPFNVSATGVIQPRTLQTMVDGKFRRNWITGALTSTAQYLGVNWPVLRYSDVLLMFAEADNELNNGPTPAGIAAFEKVRLRAFNQNAGLIGTTPTAYLSFFDAIVKERKMEFGGEGIRKYDLIRWNLLGQKLADTKAELAKMAVSAAPYDMLPKMMYFQDNSTSVIYLNSLYNPAPTTAPANSVGVTWIGSGITSTISTYYAVNFTANKSELLPIPQSAIDANPLLTQDYGY